MNKRLNRTNRNYIIAGLCMILVIMGVGYAAFQSQLKISGTSNIASNFLVKITDIQSSVQSGQASDAEAPTHTDTTATFKTNLVSPGDSMKYDITVENQGNIDAVLESIEINDGNNPAITFQTSGIENGDELQVSQSDVLTVIVSYDSNVTSQPENTSSIITVTLNYKQKDGTGGITPGGDQTIGGQEVEIVESGDGLYKDTYEEGRLIYRGQNPNNYITFNDETWRIIAKETDGTYKIIRNDVLPYRPFDEANHRNTENNSYCDDPRYGCGVYAAVDGTFSSQSGSQSGTVTEDSSIKIYLNDDYYVNNINSTAKGQMTAHSFNIGVVEWLDQSGAEADSIEKNIAGEKKYQWTGNVGLVNVSDILRASINPPCTSCTSVANNVFESGTSNCDSNYLFEIPDMTAYWTINAVSYESGGGSYDAWYAFRDSGGVGVDSYRAYAGGYLFAPLPVVFLKSSTTLSGSGTSEDPFTIV